MAQNGPKMTSGLTHFFCNFFLSEKAVPQTFSLLECMLISDLTFCDSCANWVAALWRFGAEAPSPHPDALRSCWLFWMLLTQQLIESIIHNNLIDWCWGSSSHTQGWVKKEMLGTCSRVCFTLSMSLVREASTEKISRICCWASISGLRGPPSLISTLIGGFEGSISYCFICI